ncbi:MAG: hypothetical protein NZ898_00300 [Myxococcota bacterium]|nr:hypothetical protein [Myxococcota bacterium]MDW8361985.1 hypothetical protein [Myxococcales bacterium]
MNLRVAFFLLVAHAAVPAAHAQVELTGTYVRYFAVNRNGTFVTSDGRSTMYGETAGGTTSCDFFYPGAPVEGFTIELGSPDARLTNGGPFLDGSVAAVFGPTLEGRSIRWRGRGSVSGRSIEIDQVVSYEPDDRFVRVQVTITNTGTSTIPELYYLRNADPDHGSCPGGPGPSTANDVRRQPPGSESALVTAAVSLPAPVVLGIGSHDPRARVHAGGFENTDASGQWNAPEDPEGAEGDVGVDIVFRETSLAAGASTTFEWLYVFGTTVADVETRFDELGFPAAPCTGRPEGSSCTTTRGLSGICRAGRCCTGCWTGSRCVAGTRADSCGRAGAMCRSCADGDACTSDVCTAGTCSNPHAPSGTACDDGLFCTATDRCDGRGRCVGSGDRCDDLESCTTDRCDETMDRCTNSPLADLTACMVRAESGVCRSGRCCVGCWDATAGRCQTGTTAAHCGLRGMPCRSCIDGVDCSSDVCTAGVCSNPDAPSGTPCDDGLFCTATDRCDGRRNCVGSGVRCDDRSDCTVDRCDEAADRCEHTPAMGRCSIGGVCLAAGTVHSLYPCLVCDPTRHTNDWSPRPEGTECAGVQCIGGRLTMRSTCDAAGECVPGPSMPCPTGRCASATACEMVCTDGSCRAGEYCDRTTGRCLPLRALGSLCTEAGQCQSGLCVDGRCCEETCTGTCRTCASASMPGRCVPHTAGTDPDGECAGAGCDGAGACRRPDGGTMSPDAGRPDAGRPDAALADAAGTDAAADAPISSDAAWTDASTEDARREPRGRRSRGGCTCLVASSGSGWLGVCSAGVLLGVLWVRRSKRRQIAHARR